MPEPLEIIFKTRGLDTITRAADKASKAWDKVGASVRGSAGSSSGSSGRNAGSSSRGTSVSTPVMKFAQAFGGSAGRDVSKLASVAQSVSSAAKGRVSRSGGGGGASSAGAAEAGEAGEAAEAAGPIGVVAVAALAAATGIYKLAETASAAATKFAGLGFATGSGSRTTSRLSTIGNAIGLAGEQIGGMSASLQERITTDPQAMATARHMGVYNSPRPYGDVDEGKNLLKVIEGLRKITDKGEQIRTARTLGVEDALPLTNLSDKQFDKVKGDADTKASIFTPQFSQDAADFQSSIGRVADSIENVIGALGKPVLEDMTNFFNGLADGINSVATFINEHQNIFKALGDLGAGAANAAVGNFKGVGDSLGKAYDDLNSPAKNDGANDALNANAAATERNTAAVEKMSGIYGRGERLQNALGDGSMGGDYLRHGLQQGGFRLGAF